MWLKGSRSLGLNGLGSAMSPQACMFEHLVSSWWHRFGKLWTLQVGSGCGRRSLGAGLEGSTCLWLRASPFCFLMHGDVKTHAPALLLTGLLYHTLPAILGQNPSQTTSGSKSFLSQLLSFKRFVTATQRKHWKQQQNRSHRKVTDP